MSRYRHPGFVCFLIFTLAALIPAGFGLRDLQVGFALQARGLQTDAQLLDRRFSHGRLRNGEILYFQSATVAFTDAEGAEHQAEAAVGEALFYQLDDRNPVRITYLPDDLQVIEIDPGRRRHSATVLGVMTLVAAAIALGCLAVARRAWRRA